MLQGPKAYLEYGVNIKYAKGKGAVGKQTKQKEHKNKTTLFHTFSGVAEKVCRVWGLSG